jgi:hypothetical protein
MDVFERTPLSRMSFEIVVKKLMNEGGDSISVSCKHLKNFITSARAANAELPLTHALDGFLKEAPPSVIENGQHVPSFWTELLRKHKK